MPSISLVIVALNEERTIGRVIAAAHDLVNEVILVDSGSTDRTMEIAREMKARVVSQEWLGYAAQKNFAMEMATSDWILSLDADEIMTPVLVQEIKSRIAGDSAAGYDGFEIPRILYIGETPIKHGGFYPDAQLRLVRRGKGRFNDRLVHEAIKVTGKVGRLRNHMDHFAYTNVEQFKEAMEKYARLSAQEFSRRSDKKKNTNKMNELFHPVWTFFYRYLLRRGFLDGTKGLQLSLIYSDYVRRKIKYTRQLGEQLAAPH